MNHIKSYKLFEADIFNSPILTTTKEDLTDYYHCPNCKALFKTFNKEYMETCPYCGNSINNVSDFDYMSLVKQHLDPDEFENEMEEKRKRDNEYLDLIGMGIDREIKKRRSNIN